jgi:hypothetical protein
MTKTRVVRHIYLVRHGQYHTRVKSDDEKQLTDLGEYEHDMISRSVDDPIDRLSRQRTGRLGWPRSCTMEDSFLAARSVGSHSSDTNGDHHQ